MKAVFDNLYTRMNEDLIRRLAEIEQSDAEQCARCGGEDCVCCEIYIDRMRWTNEEYFDE